MEPVTVDSQTPHAKNRGQESGTPKAVPRLELLQARRSLLNREAAEVFAVSTRTIHDWVKHPKLYKTSKGRIAVDQTFSRILIH